MGSQNVEVISLAELYEKTAEDFYNGKPQTTAYVNIDLYNVYSAVGNYFYEYRGLSPYLSYATTGIPIITAEYYNQNVSKVTLTPNSFHSQSERDAMISYVNQWVAQNVPTNASDREKIDIISEYIRQHDFPETETKIYKGLSTHSPLSLYQNRIGYCSAFAAYTELFLRAADIEFKGILGVTNSGGHDNKGGPHAWLMVKVDGSWYHSDMMWMHYEGPQSKYKLFTDAEARSFGRSWDDSGIYPASY